MLYLDLLFLIHPKMIEKTEFATCWEQVIDSSHNTVKIFIHKISDEMSQKCCVSLGLQNDLCAQFN